MAIRLLWLKVCLSCAGKTTLLRDIVSKLANKFDMRVVVVDTWNEIGGDAAVPHACLGKACRIPVHDHSKQHEVMLQAVQHHNPEVLVSLPLDTCMSAVLLHQATSNSSTCAVLSHHANNNSSARPVSSRLSWCFRLLHHMPCS